MLLAARHEAANDVRGRLPEGPLGVHEGAPRTTEVESLQCHGDELHARGTGRETVNSCARVEGDIQTRLQAAYRLVK